MSKSETIKKTRTRNYATIVYPESAPSDWQEILSSHHIPAFISPLHDNDVNPTGEPKKPHYHVILAFEGVKTWEQAKSIFDSLNGVGCEAINSLRGYARYLCHLDNPEKHQYLVEDVRSLCGADYSSTIGLATDKYKAISEIIDFCVDENIISFAYLLEYARHERFDWFRVLCDNGAVIVEKYLKSRHWTNNSN